MTVFCVSRRHLQQRFPSRINQNYCKIRIEHLRQPAMHRFREKRIRYSLCPIIQGSSSRVRNGFEERFNCSNPASRGFFKKFLEGRKITANQIVTEGDKQQALTDPAPQLSRRTLTRKRYILYDGLQAHPGLVHPGPCQWSWPKINSKIESARIRSKAFQVSTNFEAARSAVAHLNFVLFSIVPACVTRSLRKLKNEKSGSDG